MTNWNANRKQPSRWMEVVLPAVPSARPGQAVQLQTPRRRRFTWRALWRQDHGQVTLLAALSLVVLLGFTGFAVDVGNLRLSKNNLQAAADAAAIAAALEIQSCAGTALCSAMVNATAASLSENGFGSAVMTTNCAAQGTSTVRVSLNNGPCARGTSDPYTGKTNYVEVVLARSTPMWFSSAMGMKSTVVSARSEAGRAQGTNCIFALDPDGGNAVSVDLLASVNGHCGMVVESNAWNALSCNLLASISMSQIGVAGHTQQLLCPVSPTPKTIAVPSPADPLASLPKPSVPACGTSLTSPYHGAPGPIVILGNATLYPDAAYCGGITILPTANVTFMPGTYVLKSTSILGLPVLGGLSLDIGGTINGSGVTFYNYGPSGAISMVATSLLGNGVNLSAPTSGTYSGILFFQDPQNVSQATILGTTSWNTNINGTYYFPTARVLFAASGVTAYNILVAYDIDFAALTLGTTKATASSFMSDYSSLANGSPLQSSAAVLVQ